MTLDAVLLLDIGNRQIKTRWNNSCSAFDWHSEQRLRDFENYLAELPLQSIVYTSSAPQTDSRVKEMLAPYAARQLTADDIPLRIKSTATGVDRLLASLAAAGMASTAAIVVDLGTAFTIDVVDELQQFHGGAIGPGLGTQIAALNAAAPHLAAPASDSSSIPATTAGAVYDGTHRALALSIQELVSVYKQQLNAPVTVYVCGGDAEQLLPLLPKWKHKPDLVFDGMQLVIDSL
ncbi:MAG: type III pantothenate kinase [Myxococcota bacterium]|jgi:type III pantothenate kinase